LYKGLPADLFGLGRFETHLDLSLPDEKERRDILECLLREIETSEQINSEILATKT
jgi:ATP-dependent 26S proteasome regulatory subunit